MGAGVPAGPGRGLGVACPVLTGPAARVAASIDFVLGAEAKVGLPSVWAIPPPDFPEAAGTLQGLVGHPVAPLQAWVESGIHPPDTAEERVLVTGGQRVWMEMVLKEELGQLARGVPVRDQCRLQCLSSPHSGACLAPVPSAALGYAMGGKEFQCALLWHLGLPVTGRPAGSPCPKCDSPVDIFGDHPVCCASNGPIRRHRVVQQALYRILQAHGVPSQMEVAVEGKERPADVWLPS